MLGSVRHSHWTTRAADRVAGDRFCVNLAAPRLHSHDERFGCKRRPLQIARIPREDSLRQARRPKTGKSGRAPQLAILDEVSLSSRRSGRRVPRT